MEPPQCEVDPVDYSTRLPPRKRLLASLKKESSRPELPTITIHFNSNQLRARVQELLNLSSSFPEEGIEVSKSIVSDAEEIAVAARATAMEKTVIAARARAFAKSVLDVVASLPKCMEHEDSCSSRVEGKRKQVAIQRLYDSKMPVLSCDDDEELARRLHQSMNNSPRITRNPNVKNGRITKTNKKDHVVVCAKTSNLLCKVGREWHDEDHLDVNGVATDYELTHIDSEVEAGDCRGKNSTGIKSTVLKPGKKVGIKRKKLPLSQFDSSNDNGPIAVSETKGHPIPEKQKLDATSSPPSLLKDDKPSPVDDISNRKDSTLNSKKLKLSQLYSEKKILQPVRSKPRLTTTSAVV